MFKRSTALIVLLFTGFLVYADQITKVAVIDYSSILSTFYRDSKAVRELEEKKKEYQEEIIRYNSEIIDLEDRKLNAESRGDDNQALDLDNEIFRKKEFLREYIRVKGAQLAGQNRTLSQNLTLVNEILDVIQYIAEKNGYSLVLKRSDPNLIWWNFEVDITEEVLDELKRRNM